MVLAQILEAAMLVCFGLSWPLNAYKNYKARTTAGTSWQFILLITLGYFAGIGAKFASGSLNWVLAVYFLNLVFLAANWVVYFRNCALDRARLAGATLEAELPANVKSVIVATDGSAASLDALSFAAKSVDLKRADRVEVLAVAAPGNALSAQRAEKAVALAKESLSELGVSCVSEVKLGDAAAMIVQESVDRQADLVVMGSRGLSGMSSLLLGSVSRTVTEKLACPVLVVK
ncbi:MAG: universal stress protein [Coriobacteriia bacterium]|nr:universal stress protein [Coriobacteriia bacterium]